MSIKSALPLPILIADANIHTRRLFQNELRLEGFTNVTTVGTAQELIERTQELKPSIVITSAELPDAPAAAFAKMIRAGCGAISRTTAVIATIRQATPELINTLRLAGVDEILIDRLGDAEAAGGILAVDDDEIERPVADHARQMLGNRGAPGLADDVTDKENTQSSAPEIEHFLFR